MIHVISLCYNDRRIIADSIQKFYDTFGLECEHYLVDNHFPKYKFLNSNAIFSIAQTRKLHFLSPYKNQGNHGGYNWTLREIMPRDDDFICIYDPDSIPVTPNWGKAMTEVLLEDEKCGAVFLNPVGQLTKGDYIHAERYGIEVFAPANNRIEMFSVSMWRAKVLKQTNGFSALRPIYGMLEHSMFEMIRTFGYHAWYLKNYFEEFDRTKDDPDYTQWKKEYGIEVSTRLDFKTWLEVKNG